MKCSLHKINRATAIGAVMLCSGLSYAQTSPAPGAAPAPKAADVAVEDDTVVLSPFEVSANKDIGYQATDTLAGTRIRTNLRDVGSSISVANKEFMRDIGATDNQSLLQFMVGTEVGGVGGNFGGMGDGASLNDTNSRLAPNSTTRVRGLDTADNTRDFFATDIPWDSYNTSRIDIQRGANSVLFGNGSGAGIINGAPDGATLGVNTNVVTVRLSKYGSYRGSLNLNRDLLVNELAFRFAALYDKKFYQQDPAFNRDKRVYGALRYEPKFLKKGGARTTFKLSYENGSIEANRPRTTTPTDMISPWFRTTAENMVSPTPYHAPTATDPNGTLLGVIKPMVYHGGYNPFTVNMTVAQRNSLGLDANNGISARQGDSINAAGVHSNNSAEPWISFGANNNVYNDWQGGYAAIYNDAGSSTLNQLLNPGTQGYTIRNGLNATGGVDGTITGLRMPNFDGILPFSAYASAAYGANFTPASGATVLTNGFAGQAAGIYRDKTISDPSIYDFYNKLIDGPNKREFSNFNAWNVALEQTFWHERVGFQLTYDSQVYSSGQSNRLGGQPMIGIDIWQYLPEALPDSTGQLQPVLNPNFGRPFIASSRGIYQRNTTKRDVVRATPYLELNFKDLLNKDNVLTKILGRHNFNGLYEFNTVRTKNISGPYNAFAPSNLVSVFGANNQLTSSNAKVTVLTYLGPSLATASSLSGADIPNITAVQNGTTAPAVVFNSTYLASAPAPGTAYTPPAVGLSPSAVGGAATTASENPANYVGWTQPTTLTFNNVEANGLIATNAGERREKTTSWALVDQWSLLDKHLILMGGARKDKIKTFIPGVNATTGAFNYTGTRLIDNATGAIDWNIPFPYPNEDQIRAQDQFTSQTLKTWSVVAHSPEFINKHLPWGLTGSVFLSHSENFRPVTRIDITGAALPPPQGKTKDYGFLISALDGRVSFKMTWYETQTSSADLGDNQGNNLRTRVGDEIRNAILYGNAIVNHISALGYRQTNPFDPTGLYALTPVQHVDGSLITATSAATQADWVKTETDAQAAAAMALSNSLDKTAVLDTYGISSGLPLTANTTSLPNAYKSGLTITGDTMSKGKEFELFLRPTEHWNITMNAAKTFATRTHLASSVSQWLEARWALYNSAVPANQSIGDIPWFGGNQGDLAGRVNTNGRSRLSRNAWQFYQQFHAQEGNAVAELRPWRFNIVNNYSFSRGWLKGVFVGASYRWQDRNIIGYGYTENTPRLSPSTPDLGALDVNKPFYGPTEQALDLWVGYDKKLKHVDWRIQLNLSNVGDKAHLVPINTNPDGSIGTYRIAEGLGWQLTNTFTF